MIAEPVEKIAPVELTRYRFTAAEFLRMAECGILTEDDPVELLWGEIIVTRYAPGDSLTPLAFPDVELDVSFIPGRSSDKENNHDRS